MTLLAFFLLQSCLNKSNKNTLEDKSLRKEFLVKFEKLLQDKYHDKSIDPLKQLIVESNEKYPQIIFIDSISKLVNSQLGDSIWDVIYYDGGSNYCVNFNGWYCEFIEGIDDSAPWVNEYMNSVCNSKDITPSAVVIILEKARFSSLEEEKIRLLLAIHFITLMLNGG